MKHFNFAAFTLALLLLTAGAAFGQESETKVVDEVVAQVNDGVITLSRVKREMKGIVDSEVQAGKKRDEAQRMVDEKQGELIANLINEELLVQRAKELGIEQEIEASLNQRFLQIMKQYNMKTLDSLYEEMEKSGIDPQEMREIWRKQATRDAVLQKEVQAKIYWSSDTKQLKDYFEKHKSQFTKPETIGISEIFLSFAGRDPNAVREKAKQIVAQLRAGGDFTKAVLENSDRPDAGQTKGKVDTLNVKDLDAIYANALKDVKVGGISEPIERDDVGINIIRVDERSQASSDSFFDENAVRLAILAERVPEEQKKYMSKLREDSFIKISETYRPLVGPLLFADDRKTSKVEAKDNK